MDETRPKTILVAEDDDDLLDLMTIVLEHEGYRITVAHHGGEALARVRESMPDLILLDMKMPYVSGWEFAEQYAAAYPAPSRRAPVVVVSAAEHVSARAREIAAVGYLAKPFTHAELLSEVRRRLRPEPREARS